MLPLSIKRPLFPPPRVACVVYKSCIMSNPNPICTVVLVPTRPGAGLEVKSCHSCVTASCSAHANWLAPPDSTASISACDHASLRNRSGSSSRSKNWPLAGSTGPSEAPGEPPMWPLVEYAACWFRGPCCWAFCRYEAKDSGSECDGDAGCAWGVWSISNPVLDGPLPHDRARMGKTDWREWCACPGSGSWAAAAGAGPWRRSWRC
jgi:hypothetical protein